MNPLAIFSGQYAMLARAGVVVLILAAAFGAGWVKGNQHGTQKLTDYQGAQALASIKVIIKQGAVTERVLTKYLERVKLVEGATTTIEKEVTKYVDSKPLALACMLDNRWVRLHDAAAGAIPPAPVQPADTAGALPAPAALPTITKNYAAGNRNADKLDALQEWIREQIKATNGP